MKRILKWTAIALGTVVVIAVLAVLGVSEYRLRQTFDIPATAIAIPTDSSSLDRGKHLYLTSGCQGCHGQDVAGRVFFNDLKLARLVAPNVTKAIQSYSDPELVRLLRHGVRPNGRGVAVMPSAMLYHLDDADLGSLVAYLRTLPVKESPEPLPSNFMGPLARVGLTVGQYMLEPAFIKHDAPRGPNGPDLVARGQYIAMTSCSECHGQQLEGSRGSPALSIVAAYTPDEFAKLMREGVPKDGRVMPLMTGTAKNRFSNFSADEVAALYAYLTRQMAAKS